MQTGEQLKAEGMAQVMAAQTENWQAEAALVLASMQGEFTGEDVRFACQEKGIFASHPNAWGALINQAIKHGLIEPIDRLQPMKSPRSHARKTQVYRRPWR